jgi:GxxExxY protein
MNTLTIQGILDIQEKEYQKTSKMITKSFLNDLSYKTIGCAIEVHKQLGPGLLESVYLECMKKELFLRGMNFISQLLVPINYKGLLIDADYRLDLLIENSIVVELKAMEGLLPVHEAQLLTYMKLLQKPKGVLINFNCTNIVKEGSKQMVNEFFSVLTD